MEFKIPAQTLEKVLNYLKDRPWIEAQELMHLLTNLEKINEENTNNGDTK